ncbi:fungal hydrophobin [Boletus reticuloceps]|uniref:Hydrophobin n=1 Tax=Boletus reticuloceps TaxID=495285 RepID=A0A8I2YN15_9AGAM|nr:fungal hydrophobin [Boletus reticuloceps]
MFARVLALLPLALLASASHLEARTTCNSGSVNCCNSVQTYKEAVNKPEFSFLKTVLAQVDVVASTPLGLTCNPISVIGVGGNSCSQQTVCCDNNNFNGVVAVGCTPINANL